MGNSGSVPPFRPLTVEGDLEDLKRGRVAMSLNEPPFAEAGRCVVEGPPTFRGWAYARGGVDSVLVIVDGKRYDALRPIVRPDLLAYYGPEAAAEGGFILRMHPSECAPGAHKVAVVAVGREGDAVGVEVELICRPDPLEADTSSDPPPDSVAVVDWIEERRTPQPAPGDRPDGNMSPEAIERLHGLALMWESRALLAEADAAASRVEAGLAIAQHEAAIRMLRSAEARLRQLERE